MVFDLVQKFIDKDNPLPFLVIAHIVMSFFAHEVDQSLEIWTNFLVELLFDSFKVAEVAQNGRT